MPVNTTLVNVVSPTQHVLKDTVEYHWQVGCTPTAVAMVLGYWDRHGYGNLIAGDSSTYNDAVRNAIASPDHYRDYYSSYLSEAADASTTGTMREDNCIADFLYSSRSALGLADGFTYYSFEGVGLHGYATSRGYDGFQTTQWNWGGFSLADIVAEIDAGRPVILSVDSTADGVNDHNIVVFGFDTATNKLLVHDGWSSTPDMRWIDFAPAAVGQSFGITSATFVRPGETNPNTTTPKFGTIIDDGAGTAIYQSSTLATNGVFSNKVMSLDSHLSNGGTLGIASADGHTVYQLFDDGSGSALLYKSLAYGDGTFGWLTLSNDCGLSRKTLEWATADGKVFYQLIDDAAGTASLYEATLRADGTFATRLLNADCGLSRSTIGLSTADGKTFYEQVNDGSGTASNYQCTLNANGTFSIKLLSLDSAISNAELGQIAWLTKPIPPSTTAVYKDILGTTQWLTGTTDEDKFVIADSSSGYAWGKTQDGTGIVVYKGANFDILHGFEIIEFSDATLNLASNALTPKTNTANVYDVLGATQHLVGITAADNFIINANSNEYAWGKTADGQGICVYQGPNFDILNGFETIEFNDAILNLATNTMTSKGSSSMSMITDKAGVTEWLTGLTNDDTFVVNANSTQYAESTTADGASICVYSGPNFDILTGFEHVKFLDKTVDLFLGM